MEEVDTFVIALYCSIKQSVTIEIGFYEYQLILFFSNRFTICNCAWNEGFDDNDMMMHA